jgi:hypothetical protein
MDIREAPRRVKRWAREARADMLRLVGTILFASPASCWW